MEISKIIRSKRKTIALQINDDASLIVRVPFHASNEIVNRVILKHKRWVERKRNELRSRNLRLTRKIYFSGDGFLFAGDYYQLKLVDHQDIPLIFEGAFYLSRKYLSRANQVFTEWYRKKAYEKICERVMFFAQKRGLKHNKIKITSARRRWGSCSSQGNLNFSWRLIMAPLPVLDYVVIHELVHLIEKNHSQTFWEKVMLFMPGYEEQKNWLKKNGYLLRL